MLSPEEGGENGALADARARLYHPGEELKEPRPTLSVSGDHVLQHEWQDTPATLAARPVRHVRVAGLFFGFATVFFTISLGIAAYYLYFGGNTVSSDKIDLTIEGPTTISGGDTVPLTLTMINRNPVAMEDTTLEVAFPDGTRSAVDTSEAYPRYTENLGTVASGATLTRAVRAVVFGGSGQTVPITVTVSYTTTGSNASFKKKTVYTLGIASTPLELSVENLSEVVPGKPMTFTVTVRSNATLPLENVALVGTFPFGFSVTKSSVPLSGSTMSLGTLAPGASKTVSITGTLTGQENEQRVFHFSVGTGKNSGDGLAVTYMATDSTVRITSPFIATVLGINGDTSPTAVISSGANQNGSISYTNTLSTNVTNVTVTVQISGNAVDYGSITSSQGFYRSSDHTIVFSQDTDPGLANLAPGESGLGSFVFKTISGLSASPAVTFTISVSGTRAGENSVPQAVEASLTRTVKVVTAVALNAAALHTSGPIPNGGPVPPIHDQPTMYTIRWATRNQGSAIADGSVSATLPSYVAWTNKTAGVGSFSYDPTSRKVTWSLGDLPQGATSEAYFQVAITPSTSQINDAPTLTSPATFRGYDRFAGVNIQAGYGPVTTETVQDPAYIRGQGTVQ